MNRREFLGGVAALVVLPALPVKQEYLTSSSIGPYILEVSAVEANGAVKVWTFASVVRDFEIVAGAGQITRGHFTR